MASPLDSFRPPAIARAVARVIRPIERFLQTEASSGVVLLVAAVVALVWANSRWSAAYEHLWHAQVTIRFGDFVDGHNLHFWLNDGLMVVFFLVVGLEIRREIHEGELAELKRAALPLAAAVGGMLVPALIYLALNAGRPSLRGWGTPTATDIAFAVGVLTLLGKRVPPALRVLLLALAVIDDIGAIIVIALFYSTGVTLFGIALAAAAIAAVLVMRRLRVRRAALYVIPGFALWLGALEAGVHPTIAGVVLGLLTPVDRVEGEQESPVVRLQHTLHAWVAFAIMPLFALANAGVAVRLESLRAPASVPVIAGAALGLVIGKPLGVMLASFVAVKLGLAALPRGVYWKGMLLVGTVAGIGFTMAIFIAGLAFAEPDLLDAAKIGVLAASAMAGVIAVIAGRLLLPPAPDATAAATEAEAEASTDL